MSVLLVCCAMVVQQQMLRERRHDFLKEQWKAFPTSLVIQARRKALLHSVVHVAVSYEHKHSHEQRHDHHCHSPSLLKVTKCREGNQVEAMTLRCVEAIAIGLQLLLILTGRRNTPLVVSNQCVTPTTAPVLPEGGNRKTTTMRSRLFQSP